MGMPHTIPFTVPTNSVIASISLVPFVRCVFVHSGTKLGTIQRSGGTPRITPQGQDQISCRHLRQTVLISPSLQQMPGGDNHFFMKFNYIRH